MPNSRWVAREVTSQSKDSLGIGPAKVAPQKEGVAGPRYRERLGQNQIRKAFSEFAPSRARD